MLWMLVYGLGMIQAWHFSDEPPKPPLIDTIGMLGLWVPMMATFAPVFLAISWLTRVGYESYGHLIGWIGALG
jgi:hypothetical protein